MPYDIAKLQQELIEYVATRAEEFKIPGAAVGLLVDGQEVHASYGVTSIEHPRPVDERTLFALASTSKPFTATAMMRLVAQGKVELTAPVRRYVPELRLVDEEQAAGITVLQLLNHTAGLDWGIINTGESDDLLFLPGYVAKMAELPLIGKPGERASYSQAGYNLLGLIVERATGQGFEQAMRALVFEPLALRDTVYGLDEVLIRKSAVGHNRDEDGVQHPATPWKAFREGDRANNPGGGLVSTVSDVLRWSRFHLSDGKGLLTREELGRMREQTIAVRASSMGDGIGIGWYLRTVGGVLTAGHGGSGNGQFAEHLLVPERNFAVAALANGGPDGYTFGQQVSSWALEHVLGLAEPPRQVLPYEDAPARQLAGRYANDVMNVDIVADGTRLTLAVEIKPEIRAASGDEMPPDLAAAEIGLLAGREDEYRVTDGALAGQLGYFSRDADGRVTGVDLAGRIYART
ncbi:serine hydrolase domain-containing protein [Streptomyces mesophilus]|uniref:serine hydrolase domain-containing protein n=1 Tax=Streptomyces mesophilus TaxID=1775132 RepID=UPI003327B367